MRLKVVVVGPVLPLPHSPKVRAERDQAEHDEQEDDVDGHDGGGSADATTRKAGGSGRGSGIAI